MHVLCLLSEERFITRTLVPQVFIFLFGHHLVIARVTRDIIGHLGAQLLISLLMLLDLVGLRLVHGIVVL